MLLVLYLIGFSLLAINRHDHSDWAMEHVPGVLTLAMFSREHDRELGQLTIDHYQQ